MASTTKGKHQVTKDDLVAETYRQALAASNGRGENKTLVMCTTPGQPSCFEVRTQGIVVYKGDSLDVAIELYNES